MIADSALQAQGCPVDGGRNAAVIDSSQLGTAAFDKGFERLRLAARGVSDRVPVTAQLHELAMSWTGADPSRMFRRAASLLDAIFGTAQDFGFDVPNLSYDVYNTELEAMGHPLQFLPRSTPVLDPHFVLLEEKRLDHLRLPEPGHSGRMPFVLDVLRLYRERTGVAPGLQFCAPFTMAAQVRGYERFIEDVCLDPGFAHDLLRLLTESVIAPWITVEHEAMPDAPAATGADALCSPPMTDPGIIEEFSIPYILRLRELCPVPVAVVNWWGDSLVDPLERFLDLKRRVCLGVMRAQDPDLARVGPQAFKRYADSHGLALELGVGDVLLNRGPVEAIRERIRGTIEGAAAGGRLILYLASLNAETPPAHVRAALDAAHELGVYR
jgi:uroporphyrinogen-III decarboxylase